MELLHVDDGYKFEVPPEFEPEKSNRETVKDDLCEMVYFVAALYKLEMQKCKELTRKAISYILYVYCLLRDKEFKVSTSLNGQHIIGNAADVV